MPVHVLVPDITRSAWAVDIRNFVARAQRLSDLVALGSLTPHAAAFLDVWAAGNVVDPRWRPA